MDKILNELFWAIISITLMLIGFSQMLSSAPWQERFLLTFVPGFVIGCLVVLKNEITTFINENL